MHIRKITLFPDKYPTNQYYPFNLETLLKTTHIEFCSSVTIFSGENGSGKSTILEAISRKCGIHIWRNIEARRFDINPHEENLFRYIGVEWSNGRVPGSFFSGEIFRDFSRALEEWAVSDPAMLSFFGGKSLMTQSHGQSLMSFFKSRYHIKGLYLLDEPETALSPRSQIELLNVINDMSHAGHAQFIIASHSPILMACPGAEILSFNHIPIEKIEYEDTDHFQLYKSFMEDKGKYISNKGGKN